MTIQEMAMALRIRRTDHFTPTWTALLPFRDVLRMYVDSCIMHLFVRWLGQNCSWCSLKVQQQERRVLYSRIQFQHTFWRPKKCTKQLWHNGQIWIGCISVFGSCSWSRLLFLARWLRKSMYARSRCLVSKCKALPHAQESTPENSSKTSELLAQ